MLVVTSGRVGRTEATLVAAMQASGLPGILLVQQKVTSGSRTREIDAVFLHPKTTMTLEAKHTNLAGSVVAYSGLWTVGGIGDPILGDPEVQASQQSKIVAAALRQCGHKRSRVRAIVVVTGDAAVMEPTNVTADVQAVHVGRLGELIQSHLAGENRYDVEDILAIRDAFNINPTLLTREDVTAEWSAAGADLTLEHPEPVVRTMVKTAPRTPAWFLMAALSVLSFALSQVPQIASVFMAIGFAVLAITEKIKSARRSHRKSKHVVMGS